MVELEDELAQVRLERLNADGLEGGHQARLLRHHRLALHAQLAVVPSCDPDADVVRLVGVGGKVDPNTRGLRRIDELVKVEVQVIQRVLLDPSGELSDRVVLLPEGLEAGDDSALVLQRRGAVHELLERDVPRCPCRGRPHVVRKRRR